jgi:hypothetical protein
MEDYTTIVSSTETEPSASCAWPFAGGQYQNSLIRASAELGFPAAEWRLAVTICPWQIDGKAKILAMRGPVSQYLYGTGHDTSWWQEDWQKAFACTWESKRIVMERDDPEVFDAFIARTGITLSPVQVTSGRDGGRHFHYDGRGLSYEDWPVQGPIPGGDIKSAGFVPMPGSKHPSGRFYGADGRGSEELWTPGFTRLVEAERAAMDMQRGGSYAGDGLHYGRNNTLLSYKKHLFHVLSVDEDDPEMAALVLERNAEFEFPLSEAEVRSTVLRRKGWRRGWTAGRIDYGDDDPDTAGQPVLMPETEGNTSGLVASKTSDLRGSSDCQELRPWTTVRQGEAKEKAEHNRENPRSVDWDLAPALAMVLYEILCALGLRALQEGAQTATFRLDRQLGLDGPYRSAFLWLLHGNGAPLIAYHDGFVTMLRDPVGERPSAYPGAGDVMRGNPGRSWKSGELDYFVSLIRGTPGGASLTQRELCRVLNGENFRRSFGMEDRKYVSVGTMSKIHVRLRKAGLVRMVSKPVHYRDKHRWRLDQPARYHSSVSPWPGSGEADLLQALIEQVKKPDPEEMQARLERMALA